jgi:putative transposase
MHKPRLPRWDWVFAREPLFFITAATANRQRILASTPVATAFITFAHRATDCGVFVGRHVIMPDHLHLFVAFAPEAPALSDWMKSLKNTLSKALRTTGIPAPHWQKGFFDHVLRSEESYSTKWEYVAQNPVRHGLVKTPTNWPYQGEIHPLDRR